ncbi:MAG: DUF1491 family protein [Sphingorhabdus sp.]
MIEPRLSSNLLIGALRRQAEAHGGFAVVLHKGDETAGTILILRRVKGAAPCLFERISLLSDNAQWNAIKNQSIDMEDFCASYIARRRQQDPDLWVIELDIPFAERFAEIIQAIC